MRRMSVWCVGLLVGMGTITSPVVAQSAPTRTHTTGLLLGYGAEANVVSAQPGVASSANQHVGGRGVTLGYGFTRRWALYANAGWGGFLTSGNSSTGVASADVGARYHLPVLARVVVPFLQGGVSSRALSADVMSQRTGQRVNAMTWQTLPAFGGGANVHVTSSVALSGMSTWSASSAGVASPRLHLGVLLAPGAWGRKPRTASRAGGT